MIADALAAWVQQHGWDPGADAYARIETLVGLWERYGAAMNLHGAKTREALLLHVQDGLETALCASRAAPISAQTRWLDVGSGGGFPALVVAATLPCAMVAVEPRQKRAAFLELAFGAIERSSSRVIRARWEPTTWNEKLMNGGDSGDNVAFDVATARAVFPPADWLEWGRNVVRRPGVVLVHARNRAVDDPHERCMVAGALGQITAYCFT